jgi:hypothetical protein
VTKRFHSISHDQAVEIRRKLWYLIPGLFFFFVLAAHESLTFLALIRDVVSGEPLVSVRPASFVAIPAALLMLEAIFSSIFRAMPQQTAVYWTLRIAIWTGFFTALSVLVALLFARPLQHYVMPKYGYQVCERTEVGATRLWFTDWVKNPKWCVPGKNPDWVREQAAKEAAAAKESAKP